MAEWSGGEANVKKKQRDCPSVPVPIVEFSSIIFRDGRHLAKRQNLNYYGLHLYKRLLIANISMFFARVITVLIPNDLFFFRPTAIFFTFQAYNETAFYFFSIPIFPRITVFFLFLAI